MTTQDLLAILRQPELISERSFDVAAELCRRVQSEDSSAGREMLLRALEWRDYFGTSGSILDGLARSAGLYPYLDPESLDASDLIAYEYHRPLGLDNQNVVFHRVQAEAYRELLDGNNVILSAPTSFGKSLLIDAMVATKRFRNIVVVVPTIALIDETRRRLSRFRDEYKIITHPSQAREDRNVFVLTQERVVEGLEVEDLGFFVIDEFYKLHPEQGDSRSAVLNHAFYLLSRTGAQFYMLGPNIRDIPSGFGERFKATFIHTDYRTVVSEVTRVPARGKALKEELVRLCAGLNEPTLIYCSSPARVRQVVKSLVDAGVGQPAAGLAPAAQWISEHYHPNWLLPRALVRGIGYHHGRVPRALAELAVRAFNRDELRFLVCTSTLIEGVNTKAKNVVVYDNKVARRKFDYFTFNNIAGRSGRMFQHFVGRVFVFHEPPAEELPFVDIPAFTQSENAPDRLLLQLDEEDLNANSRSRLRSYYDQNALSLEVLRANSGIEPEYQIELAQELWAMTEREARSLAWQGPRPDYEALRATCELIHRYFVRSNQRRHGVSSGSQLTYLIFRFMRERSIRAVIEEELGDNGPSSVDEADSIVEAVLDFLSYWAAYNFPRYLRTLDSIQEYVFERRGFRTGDYKLLATQIENFFLDPGVFALDEYGIPLQVGRKLESVLDAGGDLDRALERLKRLDVGSVGLDEFERVVVEEARRYI